MPKAIIMIQINVINFVQICELQIDHSNVL